MTSVIIKSYSAELLSIIWAPNKPILTKESQTPAVI